MCWVSAQEEGRLEQQLVDGPDPDATIGHQSYRAVRMLVAKAESQEFRRQEREVWLDRPFVARIERVVGRIVAHPGSPAPEGLYLRLALGVPAEAMSSPILAR